MGDGWPRLLPQDLAELEVEEAAMKAEAGYTPLGDQWRQCSVELDAGWEMCDSAGDSSD